MLSSECEKRALMKVSFEYMGTRSRYFVGEQAYFPNPLDLSLSQRTPPYFFSIALHLQVRTGIYVVVSFESGRDAATGLGGNSALTSRSGV
jgi:hypothetical protein